MKSSKLINSKNLLSVLYIVLILVIVILVLERVDILNSFEKFQVQTTPSVIPSVTGLTLQTKNGYAGNDNDNDNGGNGNGGNGNGDNDSNPQSSIKPHKKTIYAIIPSPMEDNLYF